MPPSDWLNNNFKVYHSLLLLLPSSSISFATFYFALQEKHPFLMTSCFSVSDICFSVKHFVISASSNYHVHVSSFFLLPFIILPTAVFKLLSVPPPIRKPQLLLGTWVTTTLATSCWVGVLIGRSCQFPSEFACLGRSPMKKVSCI